MQAINNRMRSIFNNATCRIENMLNALKFEKNGIGKELSSVYIVSESIRI